MRRQVFHCHAAACSLHRTRHRFANLAVVISCLSALGNALQGARQPRVAEDFPCPRRVPIQQHLPAARRIQQPLRAAPPKISRCWRHRKTFFCQADRRSQDRAQRQPPEALYQITPARAGPRHGHSVGVIWGQFLSHPLALQALQRQPRRGAPRAVQGKYLPALNLIKQRETIPSKTGRGRLGDVQCRGGCDRRIRRAASLRQHFQPGCHRQRLGGRHHTLAYVYWRTS